MERVEAQEILVDHLDLFLSHAHERSITSQLFRCLADDERVPEGVNALTTSTTELVITTSRTCASTWTASSHGTRTGSPPKPQQYRTS